MKKTLPVILLFLLLPLSNKIVWAQEKSFTVEEGIPQKVFETGQCSPGDIPDSPARAFIDSNNNLQFFTSQTSTWRAIGNNLNQLVKDCPTIIHSSDNDSDPAKYNDYEWLYSPYTLDGYIIYALVHNEYHGYAHNNCNLPANQQFAGCWQNGVTYAVSTDGGKSYSHPVPPAHIIASSPKVYNPNAGTFNGHFEPSNIIKKDGYYYALTESLNNSNDWHSDGVCIMRTSNLSDPASWRFWDGTDFNVSGNQLCAPVIPYDSGNTPHMTLSYNTYFQKYIAIDCSIGTIGKCSYSLSDDLLHWAAKKSLFTTDSTSPNWKYYCGFSSLLQPGDPTRNFEQTGRSPWLYFVSDPTNTSCNIGVNETLYRNRIRFTKSGDEGKYELLDLQFNEKKGTKALDSSFYSNDGNLNGSVLLKEENGINMVNINGGGVEIPHQSNLNAAGQMTIETKIRVFSFPSANTFPTILRKETINSRNYGLYLTDQGLLHFSLQKGLGKPLVGMVSKNGVNDGIWHKIAVTYDNANGTAAIFIDDKFDNQSYLGANLGEVLTNNSAFIGDQGFKGDIDYVTLYNYVKYQIPAIPTPTYTPTPTPTLAFKIGWNGISSGGFIENNLRTNCNKYVILKGYWDSRVVGYRSPLTLPLFSGRIYMECK